MTSDPPNDLDPITFEIPCLRARQPIGDIFIAAIPSKRLLSITYFDVRRVLRDERDFERYLGIQRPLDEKRVAKLRDYVNFKDASFPTSIILSVEQDYVRYDEEARKMTISNCLEGETTPSINLARIARVLDGQHRIAGLDGFNASSSEFDLSVTIFVGADIADQAQIFATVNLEQTKVNKSLVYDLYDLAHSRSPQKTCHNIAVALDRDSDSPLFGRIKRLGIATEGRVFEPITQATFVESIISYISKDPRVDRDKLIRGQKIPTYLNDDLQRYPLRLLFSEEKDIDIARIVNNYFVAVKNRWPIAWNEQGRGYVLNRTNGFRALMRFFRYAYSRVGSPGSVPTPNQYQEKVFSRILLKDRDFTVDNFTPGTSGEARLLRVMRGDENL
ncbi:DGQHR domain-containing protein [Acidisoma cellulosilytica]|uniref:DGQHR domain-containing protein n=1 Tax=Acidisoma cellulosilyticum TaxID=2802395 RepID=A0A963Z3T7_9PROT|nr:DGQHR domain-containing protein [Acidisoma cellulosilyticum]MCB8881951.1 DGQHR domain-containing protein [Acidisoma cellulosilyticum]